MVESSGATVARTFLAPLNFADVVAYLNGPGINDCLVCPFHAEEGQNGIEVLAELAKLGVTRRVVMPVKFGAPVMIKQRLARDVPAYAKLVYAFSVDDVEAEVTRDEVAAWLKP